MTKIRFKCVSDGRRHMVTGNGSVAAGYFAEFGALKEYPQRFYGELKLQSIEPLYFKTGKTYDIAISEESGIVLPAEMFPSGPGQNN